MASTGDQPERVAERSGSPAVRVPIGRASAVTLISGSVCVAVSGVLLLVSGEGSGLDVAAAGAAVLAGLVISLLPLLALSGRAAVTVASGVMFGGFAGGLLAVGLAVAAYLGLGLAGSGFWFVFLAGMAGGLVAKIASVLPALRAEDGVRGIAEASA